MPDPMDDPTTRAAGWYVLTEVRTNAWPYSRAEPLAGPFPDADSITHAIPEAKLRYWDGQRWRLDA